MFEANEGQLDHSLSFLGRRDSATVSLARNGSEFTIQSRPGSGGPHVRTRVQFVGGSSDARAEPLDEASERVSYFCGSDPSKWVTQVKTYRRVRCRNVYPGTDVVYYSHPSGLEYDVVVSPGADPDRVRFRFPDASTLRLGPDGVLLAATNDGELRQTRPTVYQDVQGRRRLVSAEYRLVDSRTAAIRLGSYDPSLPLVIDPVVALQQTAISTLVRRSVLGPTPAVSVDTLDPNAVGLVLDASGCTYVCGSTPSATGVGDDAYVVKWDAARTQRIYTAILAGAGNDRAFALAVDSSGAAYVAGVTTSPNFPTAAPLQAALKLNELGEPTADVFIAKIAPTGQTLSFSTFLGGDADDEASGIAIDASGNCYVTGVTRSPDFPTAAAFQPALGLDANDDPTHDAFVCKLSAAGSSLVYSTYLGGSDEEIPGGIDVDDSGAAYVVGSTVSTNFPCENAIQGSLCLDVEGNPNFDLYVTKLQPSGSALAYSTYLGGNGGEDGADIAVDGAGNAVLVGSTVATNFPTATPIQPTLGLTAGGSPTNDGFITKLNASGSGLLYSTYLGGSGSDAAEAVELDSQGRPAIVGFTLSENFPTADAVQATIPAPGEMNGFAARVTADGSTLEFSSYLAASTPVHPESVAVDAAGGIVVCAKEMTSTGTFIVAAPDEAEASAAPLPGARGFLQVDADKLLDESHVPPSTTNWADKHLGVIALIDNGYKMYDPATTQEWFMNRCQAVRAKVGAGVPLFFSFWATNNTPLGDGEVRSQSVLWPWADSRWTLLLQRVTWLAQACAAVSGLGVLMDAEDHISGPVGTLPTPAKCWPAGGTALSSRANAYVDAIRGVSPSLWVGNYCVYAVPGFEGRKEGYQAFWKVAMLKGRCLIMPEDLYTFPKTGRNGNNLMKLVDEDFALQESLPNTNNYVLLGQQIDASGSSITVKWTTERAIQKRFLEPIRARSNRKHKAAQSKSPGVWLYAESFSHPDWFSSHPITSSTPDEHTLMRNVVRRLLAWPQPAL